MDLAKYRAFARACEQAWLAPGRRIGARGRRFHASGGYRFRARLPRAAGGGAATARAVIEDRRPLLLADASPEAIRDLGAGRHRVDADRVWLSASDSSDPRHNRRRYRVVDLRRRGGESWWSPAPPESEHRLAVERWLAESAQPALCRAPRARATRWRSSRRRCSRAARSGSGSISAASSSRAGSASCCSRPTSRDRTPTTCRSRSRRRSRCATCRGPPRSRTRRSAHDALDARALSLAASAPEFLRRDLWRLTRDLRAIGARYVACQLDAPNVCGGLAGLFAGAERVLVSFRNQNPSRLPSLFQPWLRDYYRLLAQSDRIAFTGNSRAANDDYAAWLGIDPARIAVIHNGFAPEFFASSGERDAAAVRAELGIAPDARVVCALFRWSDEKDPDTFLEVSRRLVAARDDVVVVQAGGGPLEGDARRRIAELGLARRVHVLGTRRDAAALLRASQLALMTSIYEGLPNALLEAQHLGVPVVATTAGGTPEAVADGETGLLAPPRDADALTRACLELLDDAERRQRMGAAGRRRIEQRFPLGAFVDATLEALSGP